MSVSLMCVMGCASHGTRASSGPTRVDLLGFTGDRAAILRWTDRSAKLESLVLPSGPSQVLGEIGFENPEEVDWWTEELAGVHGWIPPKPQPQRKVGEVEIELAIVTPLGGRGQAAIVGQREGRRTVVRTLGLPKGHSLTAGPLWLAPDGRHAIFAVDQPQPAAHRSLHIIDLRRVRAALDNEAGLEHYQNGDLTQAAILWERSAAADPTFGDPIYNLACVHARSDDLSRAADELRLAFALQPDRFRRLARTDPDLQALREAAEAPDAPAGLADIRRMIRPARPDAD